MSPTVRETSTQLPEKQQVTTSPDRDGSPQLGNKSQNYIHQWFEKQKKPYRSVSDQRGLQDKSRKQELYKAYRLRSLSI